MKKILSITMAFLLCAAGLCACSMDFNAEAGPYVLEMMDALAADDIDTARNLLHPDLAADTSAESGLQSIADYLAGRKVTEHKMTDIHIYNGTGTSGSVKRETGTYSVTLDDGSVLTISYCYLTDRSGTGFSSFNMSLGA